MSSEENEENVSGGKRVFRATFAYLVFIAVFILGSLLIVAWAYGESAPVAATPVALPNAHSHNDYLRERPLFDALDRGFCSVEADIFLVDGELLVAHDRDKCVPDRTLKALYLQPLWNRFQTLGGIQSEATPFTLLIDIKTDGESVFALLDQQLAAYDAMLTQFTDTTTTPGAVTVIISGDRPVESILKSNPRRAGIDGRLSDLEAPVNTHQMPLISDNWLSHFKWMGQGPMPEAQVSKLNAVVEKAHASNVRIRFWGIPQHESMWLALNKAGVDLLNADDLGKLQAVLLGLDKTT
jgi:hypothetical protein